MKYEKITLAYPFNIGSFLNAKVGLEATLEEGDDLISCYEQVSKDVKMLAAKEVASTQGNDHSTWRKEDFAFVKTGDLLSPTTQIQPEEKRIGVLASDIESCTELRVLETYRFLVKKDPALEKVYDKRLKELSQK